MQTFLQIGFSFRELSSVFSLTGDTEPESVRPQSKRPTLCHQGFGKLSESWLRSEFSTAEVIWGPMRSIRGSRLYLDHQVSLYSWMGEKSQQRHKLVLMLLLNTLTTYFQGSTYPALHIMTCSIGHH